MKYSPHLATLHSCGCYQCRTDSGDETPITWINNGRGVFTNRVNDKRVNFLYARGFTVHADHRPHCTDNRRSAERCPQRAPFTEYCVHCPRKETG